MGVTLTERDTELVETLTLKVHLMTLEQAAAGWWGRGARPIRNARERLSKLEALGLVERRRVNIFPMLPLARPELSWLPGEAAPSFGAIAHRLQKRWAEAMRLETVYIATRKAANQFGGFGGKFKHRTQLTHDVHVTEIYLRLDRQKRSRWRGEELLRADSPKEKTPDAVICDGDGLPCLIVEFGGQYDSRRVERFHRYCEDRRLPYQLW